ncbi:MAG: MBL fold metallo-hydrolase, partial [Bacteroidota bacterium]
MKFTFTGTGTSQGIPVIGCGCAVCTSSDPRDNRLRTSGLLEKWDTAIVFDTGPDFRQQMLRTGIRYLDAVVFTHQHKDHTAGLDDTRPFIFRQRKDMQVYATEAVIEHLKKEYYYIFENGDYPGVPKLAMNQITEAPFQIGDIDLLPLPALHGSLPVMGYRSENFAYLTDVNHIPEATMELMHGLDVLVLDALHRQKHYSHFTIYEAIAAAEKIGAKQT